MKSSIGDNNCSGHSSVASRPQSSSYGIDIIMQITKVNVINVHKQMGNRKVIILTSYQDKRREADIYVGINHQRLVFCNRLVTDNDERLTLYESTPRRRNCFTS